MSLIAMSLQPVWTTPKHTSKLNPTSTMDPPRRTDLTSVWCGEDGWRYFAVIDCYDRSILGWVFTRRCRTIDVIDAAVKAHACAWRTPSTSKTSPSCSATTQRIPVQLDPVPRRLPRAR